MTITRRTFLKGVGAFLAVFRLPKLKPGGSGVYSNTYAEVY